jgi:hypothetical protein
MRCQPHKTKNHTHFPPTPGNCPKKKYQKRNGVITSQKKLEHRVVVSWKDAAEIKESVASDALVIPNNCGSQVAGSLPSAIICSF